MVTLPKLFFSFYSRQVHSILLDVWFSTSFRQEVSKLKDKMEACLLMRNRPNCFKLNAWGYLQIKNRISRKPRNLVKQMIKVFPIYFQRKKQSFENLIPIRRSFIVDRDWKSECIISISRFESYFAWGLDRKHANLSNCACSILL